MPDRPQTTARDAEAQADFVLRHYVGLGQIARIIFEAKLNARLSGATWTPDYATIDRVYGSAENAG